MMYREIPGGVFKGKLDSASHILINSHVDLTRSQALPRYKTQEAGVLYNPRASLNADPPVRPLRHQ